MSITLRELTPKERDSAFARSYRKVDLSQYIEVVREMEGGLAYAIPVNGTTARSLRLNMNRAAKHLDLSLRWAKVAKDAAEIFVELAE